MDQQEDLKLELLVLHLKLIRTYILAMSLLFLLHNRRTHRWWVRPIWQRRHLEGDFHTMMPRFISGDTENFLKYFHMSPDLFNTLCTRLGPRLQKYPRNRLPLSPAERIAITLRFLANGDYVKSVAMAFRVGLSTASSCIQEVCDCIYDELQAEFLPVPTKQLWESSECAFRNQLHFPNCVGAIDGKHVILECQGTSSSLLNNCKGNSPLVLLAVADSQYRFLYVDIGAYGSQKDGDIFRESSLGDAVHGGHLDLPNPSPLNNVLSPSILVADSTFQLHTNVMKPYPSRGLNHSRKIFNYRLSRARRCAENAFGLLTTRWRVFLRPLRQAPHNVHKILKATVVLHNFLLHSKEYSPSGFADSIETNGDVIDGQWRTEIQNHNHALQPLKRKRAVIHHTEDAEQARENFRKFFVSSEGEVEWQWKLPGVQKDVAVAEC